MIEAIEQLNEIDRVLKIVICHLVSSKAKGCKNNHLDTAIVMLLGICPDFSPPPWLEKGDKEWMQSFRSVAPKPVEEYGNKKEKRDFQFQCIEGGH